MARITETVDLDSSWGEARDIQSIEDEVKAAKGLVGTTTIVFLGEAHSCDYDLDRRWGVYEKFKSDDDVLLVFERGMLVKGESGDNLVQERNEFKSKDNARDVQIVNFLKERLETDKNFSRPIIFFYGGEHEEPIKKLIEEKFPLKPNIRWLSSGSITDLADEVPGIHKAQTFKIQGVQPAGYFETKANDYRMILLQKGRVFEPFTIHLVNKDQVGPGGSTMVYAIYFLNPTENAKQRAFIVEDGTLELSFLRMNAAKMAVARLIKKDNVKRADAGILPDSKVLGWKG